MKIFDNNSVVIHYAIEVSWNVYYGFTIEKDKKYGISDNVEFSDLRKYLFEELNNYQVDKDTRDSWLAWKYTEPKLDFYNFKDAVFDLADKETMKKVVTDIVENSKNDIDKFKTKIQTFFE